MTSSPWATAPHRPAGEVAPRVVGLQGHAREGCITRAYKYIGRIIVMVPPVTQVMQRMRKDTHARTRIVSMLNRKAPGIGKARLRGLTV
jgi:hypothetical protein